MGRRYLDMDLLTARGEVVVARLFAKALQCARAAREAGADRARRTSSVGRTLDILVELRSALDFAAGGEIARNLDALYAFASERLLSAAAASGPEAIDEALRVLEPLAEAWQEIAKRPRAAAEAGV